MRSPTAPAVVSPSLPDRSAGAVYPPEPASAARVVLRIECVGPLVPREPFSGRVHSVFAKACNFSCGRTLLTLCASTAGDGPATLRLASGAVDDLRPLFDVGERIDAAAGEARTSRAELCWREATVWRPPSPRPLLARARIEAQLHGAGRLLAQRRRKDSGVLGAQAAAAAAGLADACLHLDGEQATRHLDALVGWGAGLTPAGDDFLIGLLAGLDALVRDDERRRRFRSAFAQALTRRVRRTTPIAAHYLRLAADGHYAQPLLRLRQALLCDDDGAAGERAMQSALSVGASSGADTVSGLLAGLHAWLAPPEPADVGRP